MLTFLFCFFSYLLGSIPVGVWVSKYLYSDDLRTKGSGNIGATNAIRVLGWKGGSLVLIGDVLKSIVLLILAKEFHYNPLTLAMMSLFVIVGHCFPVFLKFKGGKGVASALATISIVTPAVGITGIGVYASIFLISRISSISSLIAVGSIPLLHLFFETNIIYFWFSVIIYFLILFTHRGNIRRLLGKKELGV